MFGIDDAIGAVSKLASDAITRIWPDATAIEKEKIMQVSQELQNAFTLQLQQIIVNNTEAASENTWVSGARPFVLWVCGTALAYASIIEPILRFIAAVVFGYQGIFPIIDTELTLQLIFGILGLGAYRTVEKLKGVARK